jgi:2-polyprenyl-3-methyl-5-hydroxy-6-metoxy-1,4-benzoquinol methylase
MACALVTVTLVVPALSQEPGQDEAVWDAFMAWIVTAPEEARLKDYGDSLRQDGVAEDEVERRLSVIRRLFSEQPERGIELTYDRIYSKPLTGDIEKDGFKSTPNVFMMESVKGLTPGTALDVGAGQGRNSVWLATQGWQVTAIDLSGAGLAAASESAVKAGTQLTTVQSSYAKYDFGDEQWDLIVMIFSWAPMSDPAFVSRLKRSLRPGGALVFEHVIDRPEDPFPPFVHALTPGELKGYFDDLVIEYYDESERLGDWGGPPTPIVRMVAGKPTPEQLQDHSLDEHSSAAATLQP